MIKSIIKWIVGGWAIIGAILGVWALVAKFIAPIIAELPPQTVAYVAGGIFATLSLALLGMWEYTDSQADHEGRYY